MKIVLYLSVLATVMCFISCRKGNFPCETCNETNKPPIASAGPDQTITLPADSILLDGSASSDPDGTITVWLWTKISGPATFTINNPAASKTVVKNLIRGVYQYELTVKDDKGLSAKDTIQVIVNDPSQPNHPPVANAGADQTITLPTNSVNLDGSGSTDPDNNITNYTWKKISGSFAFNIVNPNAIQTQVNNLFQGVYEFELKVTDAGGLFSKDTVRAIVNIPCNNSIWPAINASLTQIGMLSESRAPGAGAAGNKIVFAGGWKHVLSCCFVCGEYQVGSSVVDVYDINAGSWQTHQSSKARLIGATVSAGDKIFFAGGYSWVFYPSGGEWDESFDNVDIYDVSANTWNATHLSKARERIGGATIGSKVFFAGGTFYTGNGYPNQIWDVSNVVDIYDMGTNSWSATTLSVARGNINAVVIGDKIYFVGGMGYGINVSNVVDIYNNSTNSWSTSDLQTVVASLSPPPGMGVIDKFYSVGNNIIFWSGQFQVGIRNLATGNTSVACVSYKPAYHINNKIVFFDGSNQIQIYDPATGNWFKGISNPAIPAGIGYSVVQLNNSLYLGGGLSGGLEQSVCIFSNTVYKLTW